MGYLAYIWDICGLGWYHPPISPSSKHHLSPAHFPGPGASRSGKSRHLPDSLGLIPPGFAMEMVDFPMDFL